MGLVQISHGKNGSKSRIAAFISVQRNFKYPPPPPTLGLNDHLILLDMDKVHKVC